MASLEQRQQAQKLTETYQARLSVVRERKARLGESAPAHLDLEIDECEAGIEALKPWLKPDPPKEVRSFVAEHSGEEGNWTMLFAQGVLTNQRLTKVEERLEDVSREQGIQRLARHETNERLRSMEDRAAEGEQRSRGWARRYVALGVTTLVLFVLFAGFVIWRLG